MQQLCPQALTGQVQEASTAPTEQPEPQVQEAPQPPSVLQRVLQHKVQQPRPLAPTAQVQEATKAPALQLKTQGEEPPQSPSILQRVLQHKMRQLRMQAPPGQVQEAAPSPIEQHMPQVQDSPQPRSGLQSVLQHKMEQLRQKAPTGQMQDPPTASTGQHKQHVHMQDPTMAPTATAANQPAVAPKQTKQQQKKQARLILRHIKLQPAPSDADAAQKMQGAFQYALFAQHSKYVLDLLQPSAAAKRACLIRLSPADLQLVLQQQEPEALLDAVWEQHR
jgi:hypothetical protein